MSRKGILGPSDSLNMLRLGESEFLHRTRGTHPYELAMNPGRYGEVTVNTLTNFRVDFVRMIESQRLVTSQGRAFYDYVLGAGRKVTTLQEMVRIGKEMLTYLSNVPPETLEVRPMDLVTNMLFAHWVMENDVKSLREYFETVSVAKSADDYNILLEKIAEDKLINPQRYSLV